MIHDAFEKEIPNSAAATRLHFSHNFSPQDLISETAGGAQRITILGPSPGHDHMEEKTPSRKNLSYDPNMGWVKKCDK